jgi:hypothetical protein
VGVLLQALKRFAGSARLAKLLDALNLAFPGLEVSSESIRQKKRMALVDHFRDAGSVRAFVGAWKEFHERQSDGRVVYGARLESASLSVYPLVTATDASRRGPPKLQIMLVATPRKSHFRNN